ncbi:MAG: YjcZ family sporulation protein [Turicibacter sp.]|nr:YjcZ family sporulation protein [Turicibacter sp.]
MYTYSCGTPAYQQTACAPATGGFGGGFAFILVLFILLAIICSTSFIGGHGGCCEEQPRCFG